MIDAPFFEVMPVSVSRFGVMITIHQEQPDISKDVLASISIHEWNAERLCARIMELARNARMKEAS